MRGGWSPTALVFLLHLALCAAEEAENVRFASRSGLETDRTLPKGCVMFYLFKRDANLF